MQNYPALDALAATDRPAYLDAHSALRDCFDYGGILIQFRAWVRATPHGVAVDEAEHVRCVLVRTWIGDHWGLDTDMSALAFELIGMSGQEIWHQLLSGASESTTMFLERVVSAVQDAPLVMVEVSA